MSNIDTVINFIKVEPDYNKDEMIQKIIDTLKVSRSNAQVYIYNAHRKMGNAPAKVAKVKTAAKDKKSKYLPGQVATPTKGDNKTRKQVLEEFAKIEAECDEFARTHERHPNGITYIKKKNLETMREVSRRLKKEQEEVKARENELTDYVFDSREKLSREDLRELGI